MSDPDALKAECIKLLDSAAIEHPCGHQGKLAARYVLLCRDGRRVEVMFDKGPRSPANLWVSAKHVGMPLKDGSIEFRESPASILYATKDANGRARYGRHSALKPMRELSHSDLVCFRLRSEDDLKRILSFVST